jgi:threonine synthase
VHSSDNDVIIIPNTGRKVKRFSDKLEVAASEKVFCAVGAETVAAGLRVPKSFADCLILENIRESEGTAVAVSDEEIRDAQRRLGNCEGIFAAAEGAATLAGLQHLIEAGWFQPDERVVLFNTGSGLKYVDTIVS